MEEPRPNDSAPERALTPYSGPARYAGPVYYAEPAPPARDTEIRGPLDYITLLKRRKFLVAFIVVACMFAGAFITLRQTPIYRARTSLEIQTGGDVSVRNTIDGMERETASDSALEAYLQTQVVILESRSFRKRVLTKLKAQKPHAFYHTDILSAWQHVFGFTSANPPQRATQAGIPPLDIEVHAVPNTRIIEIFCDSPDPDFSADFANGMANEFLGYNLEARWNASKRTMDWLTGQLDSFKKALKDSEDKLQAYSRETGLMFNADKGSVEQEKLRQVQEEYSRAQADRIARESSYEMSKSSEPDTVPEVADNPRLSGYRARLADLRRELAELRIQFTPEHPKVRRVQAQIEQMDSIFRSERQAILTRIQNEYETAVRREKAIGQAYEAQLAVVSDQAGKMVNYSLLKREADTNRNLYDTLLGKMKEAGIAAAASVSDSRIVDTATAPSQPYKPNLYRNIIMGFVVGLGLSIGFVVVGERMDRTLKAPGELVMHLQLPELGVIPQQHSALTGRAKRFPMFPGRSHRKEDPERRIELASWQDAPSIVAESFRSVVASMRLSGHYGDRARVMLVTSPRRGDGKSTTVSNLGITLAEINQRVLLIDGDMRKPRLHDIFNVPNSWGLSDLLREKVPINEVPLEGLIRKTEIAGLDVLPSGPGPASISSLLYSKRLVELLNRFRTEFDFVLIDTSPMLSMSDARVLGQLADGTILVIRAGQTTRDMAIAAKQRLQQDGIPLIGTILVAWDGKNRTRYSQDEYYPDYYVAADS
jgi:succinoglycan biosynthesis transport protein ExoP